MLAIAKLVLLALVAVLVFALSAEARELLDYYGDCYNGAYSYFCYLVALLLLSGGPDFSPDELAAATFLPTRLHLWDVGLL